MIAQKNTISYCLQIYEFSLIFSPKTVFFS